MQIYQLYRNGNVSAGILYFTIPFSRYSGESKLTCTWLCAARLYISSGHTFPTTWMMLIEMWIFHAIGMKNK